MPTSDRLSNTYRPTEDNCQDLRVGTEITLSLNDIDIDYGKNRYWQSHHWLFPPGSETSIPYRYAHGTEVQPGFETTLSDTRFRLCHLGYSHQETRAKFETHLHRWQRTEDDLHVTYDDFHDALISIDFPNLTSADLEPFMLDFRQFVIDQLASSQDEKYVLEDFIFELDFPITLRTLCDRPDNLPLPLRWHTQDLIDNGWVALEDLTDIDRQAYTNNHTLLFGRIQDHVGKDSLRGFDRWLSTRGLPQATPYTRAQAGTTIQETLTLPVAVRHKIHHPENPHNTLTDEELRESTELLLSIAKQLPAPGLGCI